MRSLMHLPYRFLWLIASLLLLLTCRDPFVPDIEGYESLMVIEGRVTNDTAGSWVRLSRSYGFEQSAAQAVSGATVRFDQESGDSYLLTEVAPGRYQTDPAAWMPVAGEAYRLRVDTREGESFVSTYEPLKVSPPITSVETRFTERMGSAAGSVLEGLQLSLNTGDPSGNTRFYQWTYDETYDFYVPFPIFERWEWEPFPRGVPIARDEETHHCWRYLESEEILIGTTRQLQADLVRDFPLYFLDAASGKVHWGYSVRVKQYALSEAEFAYLEAMKQNTETTGSLFDPIPTEVRGNIQDINAPERPVIGYFGASTVSEYRLFIDRTAFPDSVARRRPFNRCVPDTIELDTMELKVTGMPNESLIWYDTLYINGIFPAGFLLISPHCGDCKETGSPDRPPYWPN